MHIVQSDTTHDDVDHDIDLSAAAGEVVHNHLMRPDTEMLRANPWRDPLPKAANESRFYAFGPGHRA